MSNEGPPQLRALRSQAAGSETKTRPALTPALITPLAHSGPDRSSAERLQIYLVTIYADADAHAPADAPAAALLVLLGPADTRSPMC